MEIAKCFIRLQKNFTIHRFAAEGNATRGRRQCCSRPKVALRKHPVQAVLHKTNKPKS